MAALLHRTGRPKLENRSGHRSSRHNGDNHRIAVWSQGRCTCLLNGDDSLGRSPYCLVCARHNDFYQGRLPGPQPALAFGPRCWSTHLWTTVLLRSVVVSPAQTLVRSCPFCLPVPWDALVRNGTKSVLPEPHSGPKKAPIRRRKCVGLGLANRYGLLCVATTGQYSYSRL